MTRDRRPEPAVGYLRVSTTEQADHGYGLDAQRARIEEFCERERLGLAAVFEDPGVSGTRPLEDREGLVVALTRARELDAAALVVARLDRLARDTRRSPRSTPTLAVSCAR